MKEGSGREELCLYACIQLNHWREKGKQVVAPNRIKYAQTHLSQSFLSIPLPSCKKYVQHVYTKLLLHVCETHILQPFMHVTSMLHISIAQYTTPTGRKGRIGTPSMLNPSFHFHPTKWNSPSFPLQEYSWLHHVLDFFFFFLIGYKVLGGKKKT